MTNVVELVGEVASEVVFNEEIFGEKIYIFTLAVPRREDKVDYLPVRVSSRFTVFDKIQNGVKLAITGSIRTRNVKQEGDAKRHLEVTVFCSTVDIIEEAEYAPRNMVKLEGLLGKTAHLRSAKRGVRKVCEQSLRVERNHGKVSFIPAIFWGRTAEYVATLPKDTYVRCEGELHSREYLKRGIEGDEPQRFTAYEFVAGSLELLDVENK